MKINEEYKDDALRALRNGGWTPAVLATLIVFFILLACGAPSEASALFGDATRVGQAFGAQGFSFLASILILNPLSLGYNMALLRLLDSQNPNCVANTVGYALSDYGKKVVTMLYMNVVIVLWSLLLVIPGIIASFTYAMVPYIISENPQLGVREAMQLSRRMMDGHRLDLFILYLSFIGWFFLSILTLGIGFIWLTPYVAAAQGSFYLDVKAEAGL